MGVNDHIKATSVAITDLQNNVQSIRGSQIDDETKLRKMVEDVVS